MESVGYCVRVQALDGYADKISALVLNSDYTSLLAVKHKGKRKDNPHYHIVVRTMVKQQAFRVRLKNIFTEGKGNEHLSLRSWDGDDKALSYLFHEEHDAPCVARKGIDDEFLAKVKALNVQIVQAVNQAKTKSSHTLFDDALAHFGRNNPTVAEVKRIPDYDIAEYMILHALRAGKYAPAGWLVKQMVLKVKFHLLRGNDSAEEEFARKIAMDLFREY